MRKPTQVAFVRGSQRFVPALLVAGLFAGPVLGCLGSPGPANATPTPPAESRVGELVAEAAEALAADDLAVAESRFRQAAERAPEDPIPWLGLAEVYERRSEPLRALAAARRAVAAAPDHAISALTTGRLLVRIGASGEALEMLRKARELAPDDPRPYRLEGLLLRDLRRTEAARDVLTEARARGLVSAELLEELSLLHLSLGETDEALEVAMAGVDRAPEAPGLQAALGLALAAIPERRDEAAPHLREALKGAPESSTRGATLRLELATLLLESDAEGDEAPLELLHSARRSLPEDPETWYRLATALRSAGDAEAARQALERFQALRQTEDEAERLGKELGIELNAVQELASSNQLSEALELGSRLVERFPSAAGGWLLRAKILISLGKGTEALQDLGKAGALEPQSSEIPFLEGVLRYQLGQGGGARAPLERAVALAPSLGQAWALLGILALQDEDAAKAAAAFQQALDAGTDTADVRLAYAEALERLGRSEERAEQLEAHRRLREGSGKTP